MVNLLGYGAMDGMSEFERKIEMEKRVARTDFRSYMQLMYPGYHDGRHVSQIRDALEAVERKDIDRLMLSVPPRHALADSTPILTTLGWKTHGEIVVGDTVFGADGNPVSVTAVMPKVGMDYVVTLANGEKIVCNAEHLWEVSPKGNEARAVVSTREIIRRGVSMADGAGGVRPRFSIRPHPPVELPEADLPLHPYALGAWLSDGNSKHPILSMDPADRAVSNKIESLGYRISSSQRNKVHERLEAIIFSDGKRGPKHVAPFLAGLRGAGVIGNKHIPEAYIMASVGQRLELIAGLLDTDGHVRPTGACRIVSTNRAIIDGVVRILLSLGINPNVLEYENKGSFAGDRALPMMSVGFQSNMDIPTVLERRLIKRLVKQKEVPIASIDPYLGNEVGNCISVSAEDGLYLVGESLVITHNSKSMHLSEGFPSWYLGRNPSKRVIAVSHTQRLAETFSRRVRNHISSSMWPFPWVQVAPDNGGVGLWSIDGYGGSYMAAGIGVGITGAGADLIIVDDPHKDQAEADSPVIRDKLWEYYQGTLYTRRQPGAAIVVCMTRWSEDDLVGRLLDHSKAGGDQWHVINMPAENDDGTFLWPEFWSDEEYLRAKRASTRVWNAQYMGRPSTEGGNLLREQWFGEFYLPSKYSEIVVAYDCAEKVGLSNDYTACVVIGTKSTGYDVLHVHRSKMEITDLIRDIDNRMGWVQASFPDTPISLAIEDKSAGTSVIQIIRKERSYNLFPIAAHRRNEKELRVLEIAPYVEAGRVFVPQVAPWRPDFFSEITKFPYDSHDDITDAFSIGLRFAGGIGRQASANVVATRYMEEGLDGSGLSYERRRRRLRDEE